LHEAHAVTERVERTVAEILPGADVTVHPEPTALVPPAAAGPEKSASG
jgi:divalent metal cation (Fe/Co/Zn/Cd) transporter